MLVYLDKESAERLKDILVDILNQIDEGLKNYNFGGKE